MLETAIVERYGWELDTSSGEIFFEKEKITDLTPRESSIFMELMLNYPNMIPTGWIAINLDLSIDDPKVYIRRIRNKLGKEIILTRHGFGYRFNPNARPSRA